MRQGLLTYQNAADGNSTLTPGQIKQMDPLGIGEDPAVLSLLQNYPLPNDPTLGDGLNTSGYRFAANEKRKFDTYIARLDYNLTADGRHTLFWRGDLQNDNQVGPCVLSGSNCAPLSLTDWLNTSAQQGQTGGAAINEPHISFAPNGRRTWRLPGLQTSVAGGWPASSERRERPPFAGAIQPRINKGTFHRQMWHTDRYGLPCCRASCTCIQQLAAA